jgi:kinesin family protein 11
MKNVELKQVQGALEEETVVRQAHQETEGRINSVALGLKVVVRDSVKDVGGLFDKLGKLACRSQLITDPTS